MTNRPEIKRDASMIRYAAAGAVPPDLRVFLNGADVTGWLWTWVDVAQGVGSKFVRRQNPSGVVTHLEETVHGDFELRFPEDLAEGPVKTRMDELEAEIERSWKEVERLRTQDWLNGLYLADGTEPDIEDYWLVEDWRVDADGGPTKMREMTVVLRVRRRNSFSVCDAEAPDINKPVAFRGRRFMTTGFQSDVFFPFGPEGQRAYDTGTGTINLKAVSA